MTHSPTLKWLRSLPADFDDAPSYRTMRSIAVNRLQKNAQIRLAMVAECGEEFTVQEWDALFAQDDADDCEAVRLCDEALQRLGAEQ